MLDATTSTVGLLDPKKACLNPAEKGEGSSKRNGTYSGAKGGSRGGGGASAGRKGSPEGSQGRGYAGNGKKAALRSRDEDLRDPDIRREYMQCVSRLLQCLGFIGVFLG